jgi:hypothetical protein
VGPRQVGEEVIWRVRYKGVLVVDVVATLALVINSIILSVRNADPAWVVGSLILASIIIRTSR